MAGMISAIQTAREVGAMAEKQKLSYKRVNQMRGRDKGIVNLRQWNVHYPAIIMNIVQFPNNQS